MKTGRKLDSGPLGVSFRVVDGPVRLPLPVDRAIPIARCDIEWAKVMLTIPPVIEVRKP